MWSDRGGLSVSQGVTAPSGGQWVARETASGGGSTYAYKTISPTVTDVYARFRFQVLSRTGAVDLMRFRNNSGGSKLSLLVDGATGKLATRNAARDDHEEQRRDQPEPVVSGRDPREDRQPEHHRGVARRDPPARARGHR
jgi:hypothetical protein